MAIAVLRSHDPFRDGFHLSAFGSRHPQPPMKPPRRKPTHPPPRLLPKSAGHKSHKQKTLVVKAPSCNLVMEEVKILKRGNDTTPPSGSNFASSEPKDEVLPFFSTNWMGPDPETLPKKIGLSEKHLVYAGPGFITLPSPSSLPFPASFLKKAVHGDEAVATKILRCLLCIGALPG